MRLFGGGRAHLALTESEDPLEAGLEIMASPPGKKLQSLTLLNDEVYFEAAQALGARILSHSDGSLDERFDYAFRVTLSRAPTASERQRLSDYFRAFQASLRDAPKTAEEMLTTNHLDGVDPVEAAAWTGLSSVILNLHEFITRD